MSQSNRKPSLLATLLLIGANVLIPLSILTFATGFFPYKPLLPGLAQYDDGDGMFGPPPAPPFDRVMFMVVDALRSDFVYTANSGFQYTQQLIRDGAAIPLTAHATSPTVTMPRIKAITTGSIPSFLDVILNINEGDESSSLASQDTWLAQMKAKGSGKLVLHGDDTWLKLFPGMFDRADGVSSFFVADFTEVDNNVTRHITTELGNDDWNTMILHYLGLDHIGHKGGPRSQHMLPKQREMDDIVKEIYEAFDSQAHLRSSLLVLLGDHGMNEAGNHGASSPGEVSPALVFISPKLKTLAGAQPSRYEVPAKHREDFRYYSHVEQSDIAPTLAALLGFPIPKNNLGAFIPEFLPFWSDRSDKTQLLLRNARQVLGVVTATFGDRVFNPSVRKGACARAAESGVAKLACEWHRVTESVGDQSTEQEFEAEWVPLTIQWLRDAQSLMSSMASNYNMSRISLGQSLAVAAMAITVAVSNLLGGDVGGELPSYMPLTLIRIAYGVMMFASSYVEEEHHFWYWSTTAWLAFVGLRGLRRDSRTAAGDVLSTLVGLAAMRTLRSWNQTGQKFAGEPDTVKLFLHPNPALLWALVASTYLWVHRELVRGFGGLPAAINITGSTGLVLAAFSFKLAFTNEDSPELVAGFAETALGFTQGASLVSRARVVFIGLGVAVACVVFFMLTKRGASKKASGPETLHHLFTLLAMTQSRATNIPLFLLMDVIYKFLGAQDLTLAELSTSILLLQHASFFAFGGTNSIASVDLSSAFNGVAGFNVVAVGLLTYLGNWAGPLYWTFAANTLLLRRWKAATVALAVPTGIGVGAGGADAGAVAPGVARGEGNSVFRGHVAVLSMFAAASVAFVMAACTVLRNHLFIWTVFSPKYLYSMAWSFGQHLAANVGLGGLLYWLGTF